VGVFLSPDKKIKNPENHQIFWLIQNLHFEHKKKKINI